MLWLHVDGIACVSKGGNIGRYLRSVEDEHALDRIVGGRWIGGETLQHFG